MYGLALSSRNMLISLNATAASLFIAFGVARHMPLELFPRSWRATLRRWRRSHNGLTDRRPRSPPRDPFTAQLTTDARFKAWPQLEDPALAAGAGVSRKQRIEPGRPPLDILFGGTSLKAKLSRELANRGAVDRKEFFETWEFFARCRDNLRCRPSTTDGGSPTEATLVEVAGGHGLLAVLCAVFEGRRFSRVVVADRRRPQSFSKVLAAAVAVAPWVEGLVEYHEEDFASSEDLMPAGCAVACVHGCNSLTDLVIRTAVQRNAASIVCMPCCYAHAEAAEAAPVAVRQGLGVALAADVQRTYTLQAAGYTVNWKHIPLAITPMNRVLVARHSSS